MTNKLKRPYLAQNNICDALNHYTRNFSTLDEAREFLKTHGGGSIKNANKAYAFVENVGSDGSFILRTEDSSGKRRLVSPEENLRTMIAIGEAMDRRDNEDADYEEDEEEWLREIGLI